MQRNAFIYLLVKTLKSYTVLEVLLLDEIKDFGFDKNAQKHKFIYKNFAGIEESHLFVVHFTLAEENELPEVFAKCEKWYCDYLDWEDKNIITDEHSKLN